jgi:hypothetical protein
MAGSVLFGFALVVVGLLVLIGGVSPAFLIPVIVIGLGALAVSPLLARRGGRAAAQPGSRPSGVPTTSEAAYDPVDDPAERRTP